MGSAHCFQPDIAYLRRLTGVGSDAIASAKRELGGNVFTPPLKVSACTPVLIGAAIGVLGTRLAGNRTASSIVISGLVGSIVGCGGVLLWTSRRFTGCAVRRALRLVNATRDAHWLETHPIDYA
jgi:hypothetical protein